jgi:hypothetical protein
MFGSIFLLDVLASKHCSCWSCIKHLLIKNYQYENHDRNNNMNVMFFKTGGKCGSTNIGVEKWLTWKKDKILGVFAFLGLTMNIPAAWPDLQPL